MKQWQEPFQGRNEAAPFRLMRMTSLDSIRKLAFAEKDDVEEEG
jgi:hypothetical protein